MWTTGESVLYVFLYYAVLMAIGALMPGDGITFVRSSADTDYDDGLCGECEEHPDDCVCGRDDACDTVPAVMIEPVEPIVYAQTGPWWGEPDRQD
jgi:hypothetical protein